jgi:single-strand DNA-binding protein
MAGLNKAIIIGRLGSDPDIKYTPAGIAVGKLSVATSENWKDKNTGEKQEKTEWHRVVVWRRLAEICGEYLHKGSLVYFEGKLQTTSWEKDGVKHYTTEIIASQMQMLESKGGGGSTTAAKDEPVGGTGPSYSDGGGTGPGYSDEIPF